MKKVLVFILLAICVFAYGQDTPTEFRFNSMTDHTSFEETQMFGKLNTSLPLYTITLPLFNFPIALSYNQDGNVRYKVKGGQFGDSWDLNIISTVTRRTREVKTTTESLQINIYRGSQFGEVAGPLVSANKINYPTVVTDEMYYKDNTVLSERPDNERDIFLFNVMGLSGKFLLKKGTHGLEATLIESSDYCKINISTDQYLQIISFEITDKNGYKYILDKKSNVNQNISYSPIYAPALGSIFNSNNHYYKSSLFPLYNLNPSANNPNNTHTNMIVYAKVTDGQDFWENMNISKIYDKDNNLLVSVDYQNSPVFWIDSAYSFTYMSGYRISDEAIVKEITANNQGKIIFENSSNSSTGNKLITSKVLIKDLKGNLIKSTDFSYSYPLISINTVDFSKILLKQIKDYSNTAKPLVTDLFYKKNVSAPGNILDIDVLGYITKGYYKYGSLGSDTFAADLFALQKIKYPTGGTVLYKFGPNTSKNIYPVTDYFKNNLDNQIFATPVVGYGTTGDPGSYYFTVTDNDMVFIIPNSSSSYSCSLYKAVNGQPVFVTSFSKGLKFDRTSKKSRSLTQYDNVYDWPFKMKLDAGSYKLITGNTSGAISGVNANHIRIMNYKSGSAVKNYVQVEGMRIEEIAYFNSDVAQNSFDMGNSADAEKYIHFNYSDEESNSSSGRVFNDYRIQRPLFSDNHVFYGQIAVQNRGIGTKINTYTALPNVRPAFKKIVKTSVYDNDENLLEENTFDRVTQSYTPIEYIPDLNMVIARYETQVNQTNKNYEDGNFTTTTATTTFNETHRQLISQTTENVLGKTTKKEFNYETINNALLNTQTNYYINNSLKEQVKKSYDGLGNPTTTEFKTPEMSGWELTSATNFHYQNGILQGYTQLNGTPVTLVYGYNETQLVAKIINVDAAVYYSSAHSAIRNNITNYSNQLHNGYNEAQLQTTLNNLRVTFPNALITTYTYKPMVGIATVTDENGKTTTYEYDTFNRLSTIKDHEGNILKEYHYNFTN